MTNIKDIPCPNCGGEVIRYVQYDGVVRHHSMNHFHNKKFVGKAVHREVVVSDEQLIPEKCCHLTEVKWYKALGEMQNKEMCRDCTSNYSNGCSRTVKECLQKQQEWMDRTREVE